MAFKNPIKLADNIIDLDNRQLDLTKDVDSYFDKFPKVDNESIEDFEERTYPHFANDYGYLQRDVLNDIFDRALQNAWKKRQPVVYDYDAAKKYKKVGFDVASEKEVKDEFGGK